MDPWTTLIAVGGTLAGASIAPIVAAISKSSARKSVIADKRSAAAVRFGIALVEHAIHSPGAFQDSVVRQYRTDAARARVELGAHLSRGDGPVDHFTEYAIDYLASTRVVDQRVRLANFASRRVNEWARGEIKAHDLRPFVSRGEDALIVETAWATPDDVG